MPTVVLNYHHVHEGPDSSFRVTPGQLRTHIDWLRQLGYDFVGLDALLAPPASPGVLPPRALITFDDGYENFLLYAWPLLEDLAVPCVLFLISDFIGDWNSWDPLRRTAHRHLNLDQLYYLRDQGLTFGSHSRTHRMMTLLRGETLLREVRDSRCALENLLGVPVRAFAYPGGHVNGRVSRLVQAYYDVGFATQFRARTEPDERYRVARVDASQLRSHDQFESAIRPAGPESPNVTHNLYEGLQRVLPRPRAWRFSRR